jgi:MFS family permease
MLRREKAPGHPASRGGFSALRHRDFRLFWGGAILSNVGTWMQLVTIPYVIDQLTGSAAWVGFAAFCTYFPTTIASPWAGSVADRVSRRSMLIWSQVVLLVAALGLWLVWRTGTAEPMWIIALVLVSAVANGFTSAAWQAFVTQLVPPEDMISAVRLNSTNFTMARAVGPAVAGLVLVTLGAGAAFLANAVSYAIVIGALLLIADRPVPQVAEHASAVAHFLEGIRYLTARRVMVVASLTALATAFFGLGMTQLAEPMARHMFHAGPGGFGLMLGVYGAGAVIGSLFAVTRGDYILRSLLTMTGIGIFSIGLIVLGGLSAFAGAIVVFTLLGIGGVFANLSCQTAVQVNVEESYRARVLSIYFLSFFAGAPIGALIGGIAAQLVGLRETVVAFGVAFGLCAVVIGWRSHWYRPLDQALPPVRDAAVIEEPEPGDAAAQESPATRNRSHTPGTPLSS